jgi:hypothetical protein
MEVTPRLMSAVLMAVVCPQRDAAAVTVQQPRRGVGHRPVADPHPRRPLRGRQRAGTVEHPDVALREFVLVGRHGRDVCLAVVLEARFERLDDRLDHRQAFLECGRRAAHEPLGYEGVQFRPHLGERVGIGRVEVRPQSVGRALSDLHVEPVEPHLILWIPALVERADPLDQRQHRLGLPGPEPEGVQRVLGGALAGPDVLVDGQGRGELRLHRERPDAEFLDHVPQQAVFHPEELPGPVGGLAYRHDARTLEGVRQRFEWGQRRRRVDRLQRDRGLADPLGDRRRRDGRYRRDLGVGFRGRGRRCRRLGRRRRQHRRVRLSQLIGLASTAREPGQRRRDRRAEEPAAGGSAVHRRSPRSPDRRRSRPAVVTPTPVGGAGSIAGVASTRSGDGNGYVNHE